MEKKYQEYSKGDYLWYGPGNWLIRNCLPCLVINTTCIYICNLMSVIVGESSSKHLNNIWDQKNYNTYTNKYNRCLGLRLCTVWGEWVTAEPCWSEHRLFELFSISNRFVQSRFLSLFKLFVWRNLMKPVHLMNIQTHRNSTQKALILGAYFNSWLRS